LSASAISDSVPKPPPIAISASLEQTLTQLRASPRPVETATSTNAFGGESVAAAPGRMPTVKPPASRAPRLAASITPVRPPVSSTAPRSAIARPTADASCAI